MNSKLPSKKVTISKAKKIREELGLTHLVIFGIDEDGMEYVATHGATEQQAKEAATMGNNLKKHLKWDDVFCHSTPLERKCKNCTYYKPDYGIFCFNGWSGDGSKGDCLRERPKVRVAANEKCANFEPKV